jgi:molybdopterin-guanine dinucleotide biosynthesis protein
MSNYLIQIAGPSGVGKTTLAKKISEEFKIPFINGSYSAAVPETETLTHNQMMAQSVTQQQEQDFKVLTYRREHYASAIINHTDYVSDRSYADSAAYWLFKLSKLLCKDDTETFMNACESLHDLQCNHLIFIPFTDDMIDSWEIENNDKRILSPYFQWTISNIIASVINNWLSKYEPTLTHKTHDIVEWTYQPVGINPPKIVSIITTTDFERRWEYVKTLFV